jgi:peptidoglycan hydrolase-like protein with peptidoglycan-binding domain
MKKIISLITLFSAAALLLISFISFSSPQEVKAQNIDSLKSVVSTGFSFKKDLRQGDTDTDVRELQRVLNAGSGTVVSNNGVGSHGQESTYFGSLTKAAVIKFQEKYRSDILTPNGLITGTGFVGQSTRAKLNLLIGASSSITTTSNSNNNISMTVCQFIDLLANLGVISSTKASSAKSANNCDTAIDTTWLDSPVSTSTATTTATSTINSFQIFYNNLYYSNSDNGVLTSNSNDSDSMDIWDSIASTSYSTIDDWWTSAISTSSSGVSSSTTYTFTATSTSSSTDSYMTIDPDDPIVDEAKSLDQVQIQSDFLSCGYPFQNGAFVVISRRDQMLGKYLWIMGKSQLVDNLGGALIGNITGGGDGDSEDATFEPPLSVPEKGMILYLILGEKADCTAYGEMETILRAYLTFQDEDWVKEQEGMSTSTDSF